MQKNIKLIIGGLLYLNLNLLLGLQVPYAQQPVKTHENNFHDFYRVSPPDSVEINLKTDAWLWHDENNLFIQVESQIDDNLDIGRFADDDINPYSDYIRLQLITDLDNYYAYGYFAYPLGSKYDFIRNSELESDKYWNSNYTYSSTINNSVWTVIFTIPFRDLRHQRTSPHRWKIILTRYKRKTKESYSSPFVLTKMGNDYFRRAHTIEIKEDIAAARCLQIKPHTILSYDIKNKKIDFDEENMGLDLSYNPTPTMRSKLSISPDFSDIPLDAVIDSYNSKYAPSYDENRYFFIEDFDLFGSSNLFYSRHIVQPVYAFKFSGNYENIDFGFLSAKDKLRKEKVYDAETDSTYYKVENPDDYYNILALKPVWNKFRCQFTILNRMNDDYQNNVLHTNPIWEIYKNNYIWSNTDFSQKKMDENQDYGYHFQAGISSYTRNYYLKFSIQKMSKKYALDMGRIYEDDFYGWNFDFITVQELRSNFWSEIENSLTFSEELDNERKTLLERYLSIESQINSYHNIETELELVYVKENIEPASLSGKYIDKNRMGFRVVWDRFNWFIQKISLNRVDYYFYNLKKNYSGSIIQYNATGVLFEHILYSFNADYSFYPEMKKNSYADDQYILVNLDATFNFSNKASLTGGIRYCDYETSNVNKYFGYYSNLKWKINPELNIFLGINSEMNEINNSFEKNHEKFYTKIAYQF